MNIRFDKQGVINNYWKNLERKNSTGLDDLGQLTSKELERHHVKIQFRHVKSLKDITPGQSRKWKTN